MTGKTHMAAGFAAGAAYAYFIDPSAPWLTAGVASACALIPDIDLQTSKLGRAVLPVSILIQKIFGHRTLFHAPFMYAFLWVYLQHIQPEYIHIIAAAFFGIFSHIFIDCFNPKGIHLLYPYKKRFSFAKIKTGGKMDTAIGCVTFAVGAALFILAIAGVR